MKDQNENTTHLLECKDVEELEFLYIAGKNIKLNYKAPLENSSRIFKRLNTQLPFDPTIPLLHTYPRKMKACVHMTCT